MCWHKRRWSKVWFFHHLIICRILKSTFIRLKHSCNQTVFLTLLKDAMLGVSVMSITMSNFRSWAPFFFDVACLRLEEVLSLKDRNKWHTSEFPSPCCSSLSLAWNVALLCQLGNLGRKTQMQRERYSSHTVHTHSRIDALDEKGEERSSSSPEFVQNTVLSFETYQQLWDLKKANWHYK